MKLITLWEPWASLMAIGAKRIETRHWYTPYRGWIAIHAAKGGLSKRELLDTCGDSPFAEALRGNVSLGIDGFAFPFGKIVAVANLVDCKMFVDLNPRVEKSLPPGYMLPPPEPELSFGDYTQCRYGLITENVFRLPQPIPFKSRQGTLLDVPEDILAQLRRQWRDGRAA